MCACNKNDSLSHPENFEKAARAVRKNDVDTLKEISKNDPEFATVVNSKGRNLLHVSVMNNSEKSFDYLLSLNRFDLEATNSSGQTPLHIALFFRRSAKDRGSSIYCARKLIEAGASVNRICCETTYLHTAVSCGFFQIVTFLIQQGANINSQNHNGRTPLHEIHRGRGVDKGVDLLLYHGADPSIKDHHGYLPFDCAVVHRLPAHTLRYLYQQTFNSHSVYEIPGSVLSELVFLSVERNSRLLNKVLRFVTEVNDSELIVNPMYLTIMNSWTLKMLMRKCGSFVRKALTRDPGFFDFSKIVNWKILLYSQFRSETLGLIRKQDLQATLEYALHHKVPVREIENLLSFLLSHGVALKSKDFQYVYKTMDYCDIFKTMLSLDCTDGWASVHTPMVKLICDVNSDLDTILRSRERFSSLELEPLLERFVNPKLKELCEDMREPSIVMRIERLPQRPSLLELARNAARRYLVARYNLKKTSEYYSVLKHLKIGWIYEQMLSFETGLYF